MLWTNLACAIIWGNLRHNGLVNSLRTLYYHRIPCIPSYTITNVWKFRVIHYPSEVKIQCAFDRLKSTRNTLWQIGLRTIYQGWTCITFYLCIFKRLCLKVMGHLTLTLTSQHPPLHVSKIICSIFLNKSICSTCFIRLARSMQLLLLCPKPLAHA